jgi:hypothetical protein
LSHIFSVAQAKVAYMSFMSSFTSFTNLDPARIVTNLAGGIANKAINQLAQGPLSALSNPKHSLNMLQYPQDLGESSSPFINWIQFNILESVATAGPNAALASSPGLFGGVANREGGGNAPKTFETINKGIGAFNSKVAEWTGLANPLGALGLSSKNLFQPLQRVRQSSVVISLYIPNQIVFNQKNQYSELSLTQQLSVALQAAQAGNSVKDVNKTTQTGVTLPGAELAATGLSAFGIDKNLFMSMTTGTVINPQLEVVFQQTDLRNFQFEFVMAARSESEMDAIETIIRTFRHAAAPKIAGNDGRYLIPPDEFDISFMFKQGKAPVIPRISTCVLSDLTVDLAPSGQYSVFRDGRPTSVRLTLQFTEVDLMTKNRIMQGF